MVSPAMMLQRFEALQRDYTQLLGVIIQSNPKPALDLNREQLHEGHNSDGDFLLPYSTRSELGAEYAADKNRMNPKPGLGNPDLFYSGAFYRGFYLTVENGEAIFGSNDYKTPKLLKKYGASIFGLSKESQAKYRPIFLADLIRIIKELTGCI